jgi:D-sedoheptulose 7-phosphate isomerase
MDAAPAARPLMPDARSVIDAALREAAEALDRLRRDERTIERMGAAAAVVARAFRSGGRVFAAGNGGSMSEAIHFAEELTGRYRRDRPPLPALAISDPSYLSCAANDYGYDQVFARFLEAHARRGDVFVAFSTSGASANVVRAAETARAGGVIVVALTGRPGSALALASDIEIATPAGRFADRVQELHLIVLHMLIELVERELFGDQGS